MALASDKQFLEDIIEIAERAIEIPSVTGDEFNVLEYFRALFLSWGWPVEIIPVTENRYNLFIPFGTPRVLFTTHLDVVPAPESVFRPRRMNGALYGRGACDAKGIASTMVGVCRELLTRGKADFGLLLVIGEEKDGIGAYTAVGALKNRGIEAIVNGEPTEGKIVTGHKGMLFCRVEVRGRAAHSGYPERGEDANAKLLRIGCRLLETDFGTDPLLGMTTINIGQITGGVASNVISPSGELACCLRLTGSAEATQAKLAEAVGGEGTIEFLRVEPAIKLKSLPGFETAVVSYGTDVPTFLSLQENCYLYGPGSIHVAHTDDEHLSIADFEQGYEGYLRIFELLSVSPSGPQNLPPANVPPHFS